MHSVSARIARILMLDLGQFLSCLFALVTSAEVDWLRSILQCEPPSPYGRRVWCLPGKHSFHAQQQGEADAELKEPVRPQ
jgi:hypothetical protein